MNGIFITVRTDSKRLPKKCLRMIDNLMVIEHCIERAKRSAMANRVVVCTTELPSDDVLCNIADKHGVYSYRGSVEDKLARWLGAAEKWGIDFFVTFDGDDPLCEPYLIDLAFKQYLLDEPDIIEAKNVPCGAFTYGIKTDALRKICAEKKSDNTEMVWEHIGDTKVVHLEGVPQSLQRPEIRITLDYEEDLTFFRFVFHHFRGKIFDLRDVIDFLDEYPEIMKINSHCQDMYLENQRKACYEPNEIFGQRIEVSGEGA